MTGHKPKGLAEKGFIHMINSGSGALDGTGQQTKDGKPAIKPFWEITEEEVQNCLADYFLETGFNRVFPRGRILK